MQTDAGNVVGRTIAAALITGCASAEQLAAELQVGARQRIFHDVGYQTDTVGCTEVAGARADARGDIKFAETHCEVRVDSLVAVEHALHRNLIPLQC